MVARPHADVLVNLRYSTCSWRWTRSRRNAGNGLSDPRNFRAISAVPWCYSQLGRDSFVRSSVIPDGSCSGESTFSSYLLISSVPMYVVPKSNFTSPPSPPHACSNLTLNSLSFCSTSNSNLSTLYFNASLLCLTTFARNAFSPSSGTRPPLAPPP